MFPVDAIFVLLKGLGLPRKKKKQHYNINENTEKAPTPAQKDCTQRKAVCINLSIFFSSALT